MKKVSLNIFLVICLILITGCASLKFNRAFVSFEYPGIEYKLDVKQNPRPLRIHILTISLTNGLYKLDAIIAEDPDGNGKAEAKLTPPLALANATNLVAAVNANAFEDFTLKKGQKPVWSRSLPVDIKGWAFNEIRKASYSENGYASLWVDKNNQIKIGFLNEQESLDCKMAVSGFSPLILNGKVLSNSNKAIHPRTAVGLNRQRNKLILLVVDGRQKGFSEGMSLDELAQYMANLNCYEALNLDGGGSSIMIVRENSGRQIVLNSPCSKPYRPIPVILAVKKIDNF
ncbi:MAG: phosphodiester glycosidase family protein [Verrucomicrobiia bacterium]